MHDSQNKKLDFNNRDKAYCSQNPLQIPFYAAIVLGLFSLYRLSVGGSVVIEKLGDLTGYAQQIATLFIVILLSVF